jgi:hypothetical protein
MPADLRGNEPDERQRQHCPHRSHKAAVKPTC